MAAGKDVVGVSNEVTFPNQVKQWTSLLLLINLSIDCFSKNNSLPRILPLFKTNIQNLFSNKYDYINLEFLMLKEMIFCRQKMRDTKMEQWEDNKWGKGCYF